MFFGSFLHHFACFPNCFVPFSPLFLRSFGGRSGVIVLFVIVAVVVIPFQPCLPPFNKMASFCFPWTGWCFGDTGLNRLVLGFRWFCWGMEEATEWAYGESTFIMINRSTTTKSTTTESKTMTTTVRRQRRKYEKRNVGEKHEKRLMSNPVRLANCRNLANKNQLKIISDRKSPLDFHDLGFATCSKASQASPKVRNMNYRLISWKSTNN